jgi:hypothetical protein
MLVMRSVFPKLVGFGFLFALHVCAQSENGSIGGKVLDPVGVIVANTTVQAKNSSTGTVYKGISSVQGAYAIADLPAGAYDVSLTVPGIAPFEKKSVTVAAGTATSLDIQLKEGSQLSTLGEDNLAIAADLQRHNPPVGPTPRTADGKPDLTGVWWGPRTVDPGKPEFLPTAVEISRKRIADNRKDSPQAHCLPSAVTRVGPLYQFVQSKDFLVLISDDDSPGFRQIYLNGRQHPKEADPLWYGHAIGSWDGDTLVVDRVDFEDKVWLDQEGHPHSDKLHVVDRYRRVDLGHLETETTVEDPGVLAKPWTTKRVSDLAQGEVIREYICTENNKDAEHLVGK